MATALIVAALVVLLLIVATALYNGLVRRRNQVDNAWSQIDVQLKRRYDLIPNLVETVKGYASHERSTLESVTAARANAISVQGPARQAQAENALTGALRSLFAVAESYPDLKANQNFLELQRELSATEDRAAYARQYYNDAVLSYNNAVTTLPRSLFAGMFGFRTREYFEAGGEERGPVRVQF
ncbi:MAG TPA: LemA family protein [Actinomycetes bacterium]|nr:LemA family protein [Actinomycetes bacterium]